jgi:ribosome-associated protein
VKKTGRSPGAKGKDSKRRPAQSQSAQSQSAQSQSAQSQSGRPAARKTAKPAVERIPVRGARKTKVKARPATEAQPRARGAADLAETRELAIAAMDAALDKRALAPVLIDVSAMGSYTDFIGVVSGRSDRQVDAIAEGISLAMKARGIYPLGREGTGTGRWTLLDFGAFVVHVFYHPVREFYDLESLWIEAPRVTLDVPPEAKLGQADALYGAL